MEERQKKWKLILGSESDSKNKIDLSESESQMDEIMEALYEHEAEKKGGLAESNPSLRKWLGDIRIYFPKPIVQIMQKDALEQLGLEELLLEPELMDEFEQDINLLRTILAINPALPEKAKQSAKSIVRSIVNKIEKELKLPTLRAVRGAFNKQVKLKNKYPARVNWDATIKANLKNYDPGLKSIIPQTFINEGKKRKTHKHIILLIDQSQSMSDSVIYAGIFGSILSSINTLKTSLIVFDTEVVDLTEYLNDPVELLFGSQLGGGTDIGQALAYSTTLISKPKDTLLFLITDLFEGGSENYMLKQFKKIRDQGVRAICLLALSDEGKPAYDKGMAKTISTLDIPSFACTPEIFPSLLAAVLRNEDINKWESKNI